MTSLAPLAVIGGCLATLLLVLWPLPLLLAGRRALPGGPDAAPGGYDALLLATGWWSLQLCLGLLVGFAGGLRVPLLMAAQAVLLLWGLRLCRRSRPAGDLRAAGRARPRLVMGAEGAVLFVVLWFAVILGARLLRFPTRDFDSHAYHLPVIAHWVQSGRLTGLADLGHAGMYPSHLELMSALFFLPWGQDQLIGVPWLLAWLHAGLAWFVLWRLWGVGVPAALAAVSLFLVGPGLLYRLDAVMPDVAVVGFWAAAAAGLTRWLRTRAPRDLALAGLAAGVLCGLKANAPVHLVCLVVPAAWVLWKRRPLRAETGFGGRKWLLAAAVVSLIVGGAWYVRNLIQTGNPTGLVEVRILGHTWFAGTFPADELWRGTLARVFRWDQRQDWAVFGSVLWRSYGPAGVALVLLAAGGLWAGWWGAARQRWVGLVAALAAAEAVLYWHMPFGGDNGLNGYRLTPWITTNLRFGYLVACLLTGPAALRLQRMGRRAPLIGLVLVTGAALWTAVGLAVGNAITTWLAVGLAVGAIAAVSRWGWRRRWLPGALAVTAVALGLTGAGLSAGREAARGALYGPLYGTLQAQGEQGGVVVVNSQELIRYTGPDLRRPLTISLPARGQTVANWLRERRAAGDRWLVLGTAGLEAEPALAALGQALAAPGAPVTLIRGEGEPPFDERLYRLD